MRYWANNPELLDEITTKFLPEPWRTQVEEGEIELTDVPSNIMCEAMSEGEADYWGGLADDAKVAHDIRKGGDERGNTGR